MSYGIPSLKGMRPLAKAWHYWILSALFVAEVILAANFHVLTCNLLLANTLLLLIILFDHGYILGDEAGPLFYRICGCVVFCGVLFVNGTHSLEMLSGGHSHNEESHEEVADHFHNVTDEIEEHHEHGHNGYNFIPVFYFYAALADVAIKCLFLALGKIPAMGLPLPIKLIMHTLSPLVVIGYYLVGMFCITEAVGETWLWEHADPLTAVILAITFVILIIPAGMEIKPYAFADNPVAFKEDEFKTEITAMFPDVSCPHIHAYRLWPGQSFEALLHVNIQVDKSDPSWSRIAGERYEEVLKQVQSVLKKAGAQRVFMEPRFYDVTMESNKEWTLGCRDNCSKPNTSCCPVASPPAKREA